VLCSAGCDEVPDKGVFFPCRHTLCLECFGHYCSTKIKENKLVLTPGGYWSFGCPMNCENSFLEPSMIELAGRDLFSRYKEFATKSYLHNEERAIFCRCGAGIILSGLLRPDNVTCHICQKSSCTKCLRDSHPGACVQLEDSERFIRKNAKPCPGCQAPIEKNGGCNHMTCSSCRHEFCWLDLQPWDQDHSGHQFGGRPCVVQ